MADVLTTDMVSDFATVVGQDPTSFFQGYVNFVDTDYPSIVDYFTGVSTIYPTSSFQNLTSLTAQGQVLEGLMQVNSSALGNYAHWIVAEQIDDVNAAIATANNASKWLRSSITTSSYVPSVQTSYMASQGQHLENIERDVLKSNNPDDDWADTALNNNLREEDYTLDGGYLIKITYSNAKAINLQTVIDNIDNNLKVYGLDLNQKLTFVNNDLQVLSYKDTAFQSALILAGLQQGDDPFSPSQGLSRNFVGTNIASVAYPSLFRQMASNFSQDDTFKNFSIIDVSRIQDVINVSFSVQTRAGEVMKNIIQL